MKLSILIPTTPDREETLQKLIDQFCSQGGGLQCVSKLNHGNCEFKTYTYTDFDVVTLMDNKENPIGRKRNHLLWFARGNYLAFVDSDDRIADNYISLVMEGIDKDVDACSLKGIITENGQNPKTFIHSARYVDWFEKDGVYYRNNNHLNVVRSSIAKKMKFPESNHGEDRHYSKQLFDSGLIQNEHWIEQVIYYYDYKTK